MKNLTLKIFELLALIPDLKYIDLDYGQLQEEKPPLIYPCALFKVTIPDTEVIDRFFQINNAEVQITLCFKPNGETNSLTTEQIRNRALSYLDMNENLHKNFQGYKDEILDEFNRLSVTDPTLRRGLKTTVHRYSTSWREDIASS